MKTSITTWSQAKKGERISAEVEGLRLGITEFDPCVAILNAKRFELGVSDDAALVWRDGFTVDHRARGRQVHHSGAGERLRREWELPLPFARGEFPAGHGRAARGWQAGRVGAGALDRRPDAARSRRRSSCRTKFEREFGIQRQDDKGFSPYPNAFRLTPLGNVLEKEPNDDQAHATPFQAPMALNGVIEKPGDVDQFVFKATKGQVFDIHCYARRIRSPLDPVMYLGKKGGGAMLGADDSFGPDSYFRFQAPEDAEYVIWLIDQLGKGGPDYAYRIEVTPVVPQLVVTTNAEQIPLGTGVMSIAVPKGNRQAILIYGNRVRLRRRTESRRRWAAGGRHGRGARRSPPARWWCRCSFPPSPTPHLRRRWRT